MPKSAVKTEFIDTHAHCQLLRTYHLTDENGNGVIIDEKARFLSEYKSQKNTMVVTKVINIPINYTQNIEWPNNDLRSVFFSNRPVGEGIFRDQLKDDDGNPIEGLNYFAQGLHPKFVHQLLYKDFIYVNESSKRKSPSATDDLVDSNELKRREDIVKKGIEDQIKNNDDVVAIGETGLEFYYDYEKRVCDHPAYQEKWFRFHLDLAYRYDLPLIIHLRSGDHREQNANKKAIAIMKEYQEQGKLRKIPGVIHCFIGNKTEAREFHRLGFVLGIGAAFSYGNPKENGYPAKTDCQTGRLQKLYQVVCDMPLEWMVLETDTPYLAVKGSSDYRENTPLSIPLIAKLIVQAKNERVSIEEVARITTRNALKVFPGLKGL